MVPYCNTISYNEMLRIRNRRGHCLFWAAISALPGGTKKRNKSLQEFPFSRLRYEIWCHNVYCEHCMSIQSFRRDKLPPPLGTFRPWSNFFDTDLHLARLLGVIQHKTINWKLNAVKTWTVKIHVNAWIYPEKQTGLTLEQKTKIGNAHCAL